MVVYVFAIMEDGEGEGEGEGKGKRGEEKGRGDIEKTMKR